MNELYDDADRKAFRSAIRRMADVKMTINESVSITWVVFKNGIERGALSFSAPGQIGKSLKRMHYKYSGRQNMTGKIGDAIFS